MGLGRRQTGLITAPDFGHVFRRAKATLALQGVYTLRSSAEASIVPVVYVCKASSEQQADDFHRLVWNQDVVPFLIAHTPLGIKLYSGFRHSRSARGGVKGVLETLTDFNNVADLIKDFHADSIDSGRLWRERGADVKPEHRVDWKLLDNLRTLDRWLCNSGLDQETSHALIGKYVYLHYLRDRGILSPKKLNRWGIDEPTIFGRHATIKGVREVVERLDDWLNGSVFPLELGRSRDLDQKQLRCVAGVFNGDEVTEVDDRQLSFDFGAYNFSYIPIETLSAVYQQFLHAPGKTDAPSRGRQIGAYYTPIPVVNLMLAELEERRPLERGMRVFDPSCGSGAFLVQCYRRLIEKEFPPGSQPKPGELRDLLQQSIFGVDAESDACNVTELSLILTLLDYVDPPDLEGRGRSQFKLPVLRDNNVFCENFFQTPAAKHPPLKRKFDWIVGNPPWKKLNPKKLHKHDRPVWKWMKDNEKERPAGGNQAARAFAWEVLNYLAADGEVGLFLPAMTLFEDPSVGFRRKFFQEVSVNTVVNFSNLAEVISAGRFRVPGAAFFYERRDGGTAPDEDEFIRTYSPLVANQEPTRPARSGERNESWSLVINASEVRDIPTAAITNGNGLPWKLATWGSSLDLRLLSKLKRLFHPLGDLDQTSRDPDRKGKIITSEGLQLRKERKSDEEEEEVELVEEVVGKNRLDVTRLKRLRHVFSFPSDAIVPVELELKYVRKGRSELPLSVCRPPHVIVSAARTFAIYTDEYLIVPPRQIGIASPSDDADFLKALSVYLSSDFAFYHQFLSSTEFGVKRDRSTLRALRRMPIGIADLPRDQLKQWAELHSRLAQTQPHTIDDTREREVIGSRQLPLPSMEDADDELGPLLDELNGMVCDSLGLDARERSLIHDLVHVRLCLNDGKTGRAAVRAPNAAELRAYAQQLKSELDDFIDGELPKRHDVAVVYDDLSGMLQVDLVRQSAAARKVTVAKADHATARQLEKTRRRLRDQRSQWVYFDRNLRIYEGTRTFIFKPMQRFHWTESQAMIDAGTIITETLEGAGIET
ncbi:MAG: N-6 DNA methylase [Candidatus Nealsonbacteria bacterium]|nr:N-6 DNA methylase [Candidatus Nealsonbacteria bacterium]